MDGAKRRWIVGKGEMGGEKRRGRRCEKVRWRTRKGKLVGYGKARWMVRKNEVDDAEMRPYLCRGLEATPVPNSAKTSSLDI